VTSPTNSLNPPILAAYSDQHAFAGYHLDLAKVRQLMTGDGWRSVGGLWQKNGRTAQLTVGANTQYLCTYGGTRVEYSATEDTTTSYPKTYVHGARR